MPPKEKILHIAEIFDKTAKTLYLVEEDEGFRWYEGDLPVSSEVKTIPEAIRLAQKTFSLQNFRLLHCGTKFTLPERDEHGTPATYREMLASLATPSGVFLDKESGHMAQVREIPLLFISGVRSRGE